LKFDLSAIQDIDIITKAELWLYVNSGSNSVTVDLYHVSNITWSEATITWNTSPGYDAAKLDSAANPTP